MLFHSETNVKIPEKLKDELIQIEKRKKNFFLFPKLSAANNNYPFYGLIAASVAFGIFIYLQPFKDNSSNIAQEFFASFENKSTIDSSLPNKETTDLALTVFNENLKNRTRSTGDENKEIVCILGKEIVRSIEKCKSKLETWLSDFHFIDLKQADKLISWNNVPKINLNLTMSTINEIQVAHERIKSFIHRTPVLRSPDRRSAARGDG